MTMLETRPALVIVVALLPSLFASCTTAEDPEEGFDVVEATIPEMQRAMEEGRVTSRELVEAHKTVMTELANFTARGMPGNYSAVGGFGLNRYDPRRDPREGRNDGRPVMGTGGSSSGIGTASSFWAGNVGTETSSSREPQSSIRLTSRAWNLGSAGLSDRHRAVRLRPDRAGPADAGRLRPEAPPVRCELRGDGVQRAAADRVSVRLRAGDDAPGSASGNAVGNSR